MTTRSSISRVGWSVGLSSAQRSRVRSAVGTAVSGRDQRSAVLARRHARAMEARLNLLAEQLEREEGEAGDVNVYGVALLQSIVRPKLRTRVAWLAGALLLALLEVLSLQAIAFSTGYKMCVYDDECPLGTACVRDSSSSHAFFCADCREVQHVSTTGELGQPEWARLVARLIGTGRKGAMSTFTPARTNDRWPVAANSSEYCSNFLASEFVSAWRGGRYSDFEKCLHVQEALRRYGILDALVTMVALFLVCLSISADRKQQLMNRHLRETLARGCRHRGEAGVRSFCE